MFISLRKSIAEQYAYVERVHLKLQDASTNRYKILERFCPIFNLLSKFVMALILSAAGSMLLFPSLLYVYDGSVESMLPIMIPGLDETTRVGYVLLQIVHVVWLACGAFGYIGSDLTFIMLSLYSWPLCYLFIDHLKELNKQLRKTPECSNTKQMRLFLRNIVHLHQELCM